MTSQNMYPCAKEIPTTQPTSLRPVHCLCLQGTSRIYWSILFLGVSVQLWPCKTISHALPSSYLLLSTWLKWASWDQCKGVWGEALTFESSLSYWIPHGLDLRVRFSLLFQEEQNLKCLFKQIIRWHGNLYF